ncbi:MAG: phage holin family protein [Chloroflexota bacterium]|nr:phage holin family protein [Chloroflexota bacterium]
MAEQLPPTERQSIRQLLRRIINGFNGVVDRQVQLVKQEIKENVVEALQAGKSLAIGAGIAIVGALILLDVIVMAIVLGLNWISDRFLGGPWLGWVFILVILAVTFYVAFRFVMRGLREIKITPLDRTRTTLKEDVRWARQLLTRNGR